jgi:hypothetical protein
MRVTVRHLTGIAAAALLVAGAGTAQAQGKGHGKAHRGAEARSHEDREDRDDRRVDPRHQRSGRDDPRYDRRGEYDPRYEHRGDYDRRYERNGARVPPGLAKKGGLPPGLAKKPGGMPPGQYRKRYSTNDGVSVLSDVLGRHGYHVVRETRAGDSRYVYYRGADRTLHRAVVSPGADRPQFGGLAGRMLREVQSQLP